MIYFIRAGATPWVKIGLAADVDQRLSFLQVGNHEWLVLLASVEGDRSLERFIHVHLRGHKRRGEWFEDSGVVSYLLALIVSGGGQNEIRSLLTTHQEIRALNHRRRHASGWLVCNRRTVGDVSDARPNRHRAARDMPHIRRVISDLSQAINAKRARLLGERAA